MAEGLTLWTAQAAPVLEALEREGVCRVRRAWVAEKYGAAGRSFQIAYGFFAAEAAKRLPPPQGAESPFWLYANRQWAAAGSGGTLLRVEAPRALALLFDLRDWNRILNLSYLPENSEDEAAFSAELSRHGVRSAASLFLTPYYPQLKARVLKSWLRLFTAPAPPPEYAQAALWELRRDWVTVQPGP